MYSYAKVTKLIENVLLFGVLRVFIANFHIFTKCVAHLNESVDAAIKIRIRQCMQSACDPAPGCV